MTITQGDNPVHLAGQFRVMRCNQRCQTGFTYQRHQHAKHGISRLRIKVAGRFICEQDIGHIGQCTGNGDTLLFAA